MDLQPDVYCTYPPVIFYARVIPIGTTDGTFSIHTYHTRR